ncbi:hypothetical protein [Streptomyces sp. NPDC002057]|uniref:hypothetical protein n=1 Tax=Streptomyces sp. NPDC002057 TaxID=3154664 RepID=UPI00331B9ED5
MARENRDRGTAGGAEGDARYGSGTPRTPGAAGGAGGPAPDAAGGVPSPAVPSQRTGHAATPPSAPPASVPPPPTPPPAMPLSEAPQSAVPSEDPGATGRSGGSRANAPTAPPAAPRGRDTTDRPVDGRGAVPGNGDGRGRAPGDRGRHEAAGAGAPAPGTEHGTVTDGTGGPAGQLLGEDERDRLGQRLHHALAGFVDSPHDAVVEAAEVLSEAEQKLIAALRDRRTALRAGWQETGGPDAPGPDTEQLRLTLRTYREVTERLLRA